MGRDIRKKIVNISILPITLLLIASGVLLFERITGKSYICPLYYYFDFNCPGCGSTRMLKALLNFDIYQAFRYNSFIFLTMPLLILLYAYEAYLYIKTELLSTWLDLVLAIYAVLLSIYGIVRNIEMFKWLLPTKL